MQLRVWEIESDIEAKQFDASLEKYRFRERCAVLQQPLTLVEVWCRYCEFKTPQWAETTVILHINRISKHIEALPFQKLSDANDILMYLIKTQSQDTTCRILAEIKASCNWAFKSKLITSNPFADISFKPPKAKPTIDPFTPAETLAIIQAFESTHYGNFVKFLFMTGCRSSEAFGLKWKNVTPDHILFSEARVKNIQKGTKTGLSRRFPCNDALRSLLDDMRSDVKPDALVFTSPSGTSINSNNFINNHWKGRRGRHGIIPQLIAEGKVYRYRPQYNTRHTFITHCIASGIPVPTVASWVGNSPEIIFKHYCGISPHSTPSLLSLTT
ncbi:tyrosine-type recombinase/integrase [Chroococcidiopsis sp. CCMEE 29]|uniref:tyrosine-type recombinase/integrase n=1 Tax=Chroococcidiopsis sp. CCMEE 29 TaxID=155894 RepID=UPI0020208CE2|nr:tyrosine-type recombinase/integrase [Chroococcidiopsis sp. CCMEE 29]